MKDSTINPRVQCHICGKWRRLYKTGRSGHADEQTMYGGDSDCGNVCTYCVEKLGGYKEEKEIICPRCNITLDHPPEQEKPCLK
jgi:hypothetical protein